MNRKLSLMSSSSSSPTDFSQPAPGKIAINPSLLLLYIFCLSLNYLAAVYLGGFMLFLFYTFAAFLVLALILFIININSIRSYQQFSTEHPQKGDAVEYNLIITNESSLPVPCLLVSFITIGPGIELGQVLPDFSLSLRPGAEQQYHYTIHCAYRGTYYVGLKYLEIRDITGCCSYKISLWYRTFYVYPRVIKLTAFFHDSASTRESLNGMAQSWQKDFSLFREMHEYRSGESIQHMYWKKFAATGLPLIKDYDSSQEQPVTIYFDLRREGEISFQVLEKEDTTIETLVALVKYYLDQEIPISVFAPGRETYTFSGCHQEEFAVFYQSTINLLFQDTYSPARLYRVREQSLDSINRTQAVVFISHRMDDELFSLLENSAKSAWQNRHLLLVFNHAGSSQQEKEKRMLYFNRLRDKGCAIIDIHSAEQLAQDLERTGHEDSV